MVGMGYGEGGHVVGGGWVPGMGVQGRTVPVQGMARPVPVQDSQYSQIQPNEAK